MSDLPNEIYEEIIRFVDSSWRSRIWDLRRCSLVCKTWQPIAQRLLFRKIELSLYKEVARETQIHRAIRFRSTQACEALAQSLYRTLESAPHISFHIRQLHLEHFPIEACPPDLFRKLHNLECLKVRGLHWRTLSTEIQDSLMTLCASLSELAIEDSSFGSYSQLFSLLANARNLRSLKLTQIRDSSFMKETPESLQCSLPSHRPASLDCLHLDISSAALIPFLIHPRVANLIIDVTKVRKLLSSRSAIFYDVAEILLPAISLNGTLEDVELQIYLADMAAPPSLPASLYSVRYLHLTAHDPKAVAGPWLVSFFTGFSSSVSLECVAIDLELSNEPTPDYWRLWVDLDGILSARPFRSLRKVKLAIYLSDELSIISEEEMSTSLKALLPRLHGLGVFEFQLHS